ncbi:MAG: hypothetical protein ACI9VR_004464, partial [Cognaticolwellia sp.]
METEHHTAGPDTWSLLSPTGTSYADQVQLPSVSGSPANTVIIAPNLDGDAFADLLAVSYYCETELEVPAPFEHILVATYDCSVATKAWINDLDPPIGGFELFDTVEPKFDGTHSIAIDYAAKLRTVLESGNDIVVAK